MRSPARWLPLLLLTLLTACTGTPDNAPAVRLVILDNPVVNGAATPTLIVADPNPSDTSSAGRATATAVTGAVGVETLAGVNRLAVAFPDHVELFQATEDTTTGVLGLQPVTVTNPTDPNHPSWFALPQRTNSTPATIGTPCFTKMRADNTRTLLVLLSACAGQAQQEVVLNTSSSDPTASWWRDLPAPQADPTQTFIAVNGATAYAARLNPSTGSDVLQGSFGDGQTSLRIVNAAGPLPQIYALVNSQGTVFAATNDNTQGVRPVGTSDLGTPRLAPRAQRLFADGDVLAAWNDSNFLFLARGNQNNTANPLFAPDVRGVAVPPDGYAYALSGASLLRYDVLVGLSSPGNSFGVTSLYLPTGLVNPTDIAWVVPQ